jgi:hypothetical protein
MNIKKLLIMSVIGLATIQAKANDDIELGIPSYGGNGCPAGSASATLSPDAKQLSILFDSYIVEAGRSSGKSLDRKSCNVAIPVHVPQGYSISILRADYRGFVSVPRAAQAQFTVEYFFAGMRGPRIVENFNGPQDRDYLLTDHLTAEALVWSPCGADVNLRINSSMLAKTNRNRDDVLATVDSTDVDAQMVYHLQWRQCR